MKRYLIVVIAVFMLFPVALGLAEGSKAEKAFPQKPIKIIVYTKPGGLIDITARKFTDIATKYTKATFVVENKPGAGGIVAMKYILEETKADGYTLFAATKSNISKVVASKGKVDLFGFDWIAMLMADPECVITNKKSKIRTWQDIVEDAKAKNGEQIWVGPAAGGLDHVTALKLWEKAGIKAKWIPFASGGKAIAALLGGQGVAYVGNPRDTIGKPDLMIAAVSSPERLKQFPDVPTFGELGIKDFDHEIMWRGFAVKKGTPEEALKWYDDLFTKVTNDPDWRKFWEVGGIKVVYYKKDKFEEIIKNDQKEFEKYLKKIGMI